MTPLSKKGAHEALVLAFHDIAEAPRGREYARVAFDSHCAGIIHGIDAGNAIEAGGQAMVAAMWAHVLGLHPRDFCECESKVTDHSVRYLGYLVCGHCHGLIQ